MSKTSERTALDDARQRACVAQWIAIVLTAAGFVGLSISVNIYGWPGSGTGRMDAQSLGSLLQGCLAPAGIAWAVAAYFIQGVSQLEQQAIQQQQMDLAVLPRWHVTATHVAQDPGPGFDPNQPHAKVGIMYKLHVENSGAEAYISSVFVEGTIIHRPGDIFRFPPKLGRGESFDMEFPHIPPATQVFRPTGPVVIYFTDVLGRRHRSEFPIHSPSRYKGDPQLTMLIGPPTTRPDQP